MSRAIEHRTNGTADRRLFGARRRTACSVVMALVAVLGVSGGAASAVPFGDRCTFARSTQGRPLEVVRRGDVRRAKLNYLRDRKGKSARVREKRDEQQQ